MLSEKEINLVLGKDLNVREKKEDLNFRDWLTVKGIAPLTVKHTILACCSPHLVRLYDENR